MAYFVLSRGSIRGPPSLLTAAVLSQCLYDILINVLLFADNHLDDNDHGPLLGEFEPNVVCNGHARLQSEV